VTVTFTCQKCGQRSTVSVSPSQVVYYQAHGQPPAASACVVRCPKCQAENRAKPPADSKP
jgi:hypothetical protein